ncbi:MAG: cysteine hydrolase family protein [Liquorilactobacillus hordei]|uniref:cysteine hydrolase family protein n=1 Tax=Lactobacillaceae TaxID=33958 RepID=UPI001CC1DFBC|nr:cysteine hydrolase family protein [Lentilactobacillus hilgardii]MBZ2202281.1 cysteine hydrolase [Lentilactobacillus hilgardii]MBZ2205289.1 cysteine hydrolase [Lentilactobacillus hilgardii]
MADVLMIIDMQNGVCRSSEPLVNLTQVISGIKERIDIYRSQNKPVIFVQHNDKDLVKNGYNWKIIDDFKVASHDILIQKSHANSFYHTDLQKMLDKHGIRSIEICGAQVEFCVDTTIKMAHGLGYHLEMVRGLTTTTPNQLMTAQQMINFYQDQIWDHRFLKFIEPHNKN